MSKISTKPKKFDLDKVCRTCLSERGHLRDISDTKMPKMIQYCASVQISPEDVLPRQICVSCFHQFAKFYVFKKKVERSSQILQNYYAKYSKRKAKKAFNDILCEAVNEAEIIEKNDAESDNFIEIIEDFIVKEEDEINNDNNKKIDFTNGPPPLIPLKEAKKISLETVDKTVYPEAPPLIPIKPIEPSQIEKVAPDLKLECTVCGDEFNSVIALKQHRQFKCQTHVLQCNVCKKEFNDRKKLIGHLKGHMVEKVYGCKLCGKRYPNPSTFTVHMRTHTGERPFKCQVCNKGFVRWAGVVGHMKTHTSVKPYKCDKCDKAFKIATNLERHKVLHSGCLPFCCNFCGKTFSQADNLQLHIRTYHTFEKPFLCNECGKSFVSSTRLNRHMWVHSGYKPYKCKDCPKTYSNLNDLRTHAAVHSGEQVDKPHGCTVCNMRFSHACRLKQHMKIHELKQCQQCSKSYTSYFMLNRHIEMKHLNKQFYMKTAKRYIEEPPELIEEEIVEADSQSIFIKFD